MNDSGSMRERQSINDRKYAVDGIDNGHRAREPNVFAQIAPFDRAHHQIRNTGDLSDVAYVHDIWMSEA